MERVDTETKHKEGIDSSYTWLFGLPKGGNKIEGGREKSGRTLR